jgi:hypothetical protein
MIDKDARTCYKCGEPIGPAESATSPCNVCILRDFRKNRQGFELPGFPTGWKSGDPLPYATGRRSNDPSQPVEGARTVHTPKPQEDQGAELLHLEKWV